ncbi:MAG TPA: hypothetical protein P5121_32085 [Caldilineaceae bacterium]|nr:hypothetical protein [Caldilineaceae bacterium]
MKSVYRLNAEELDYQFLESLKSLFKNKEIEIVVSEVDETAYLMSSAANRRHLLQAIKNIEEGTNLITVDIDELEALADEP